MLILLFFVTVVVLSSAKNPPYHARGTGRLGNQLFEEFFWRLKTAQMGEPFTHVGYDLSFPFDQMPAHVAAEDQLGYDFSSWTNVVPDWPFSFRFYRDNRLLLMSLLPPPRKRPCDVVVHLRLEDIFNSHPDYTAVPIRWYEEVFRTLPMQSVCLIGHPIDEVQRNMMRRIERMLAPRPVRVLSGQSIEADYSIMYGCRVFVGSTSTFWFWPVWLSPNLQIMHVPGFGVTTTTKDGAHPPPEIRTMELDRWPHPLVRVWPLNLPRKMSEREVKLDYGI